MLKYLVWWFKKVKLLTVNKHIALQRKDCFGSRVLWSYIREHKQNTCHTWWTLAVLITKKSVKHYKVIICR